jgi:hypothetical protein
MADARPAKMPDPRRYSMTAEMRHAAAEVSTPSTAKMRHAATAEMTNAAADVNTAAAAAAAAPMGELRLPGGWREEK